MKTKKRSLSIFMVVLLMLSVLATGCEDKKEVTLVSNLGDTYPLETDATLTYWTFLPSSFEEKNVKNFGELPLAKELEKQTGVKVEWQHPSVGSASENFNLLLASGDLPDIIQYPWMKATGGGAKAVSDGYILNLNEIIDAYAPDAKAALKECKGAEKTYKTDDGYFYCFPMLHDVPGLNTGGLMLRKDWLDELGLEVPETIDEWHTVLTAFKEKKGAKAPLTLSLGAFTTGCFTGAYGILLDYYVEDGKIKNGYMEEGFKEFIALIKKWQNEGIFDKNFTTIDSNAIKTNMLTGNSGATFGGQGGAMGTYLNAKEGEKFDLIAAPYPVLKKGEKCNIVKQADENKESQGAAITSKCKNVELAAKYLNFGYTEAGRKLYNYGIEGVSYTMDNGIAKYTDIITNNKNGVSMAAMLNTYTRSATYGGPFVSEYNYLYQYAQRPQQKAALEIWMDQDGESQRVPALYFTEEEQYDLSQKLSAVETYSQEMFYRFLSGAEPLENFDKYIAEMKRIGADDVLDAYQSAYERYLER